MNIVSPLQSPKTWISVSLVLITLAAYGQVIEHQFINYDDNLYVYENEYVTKGLTFKNFTWAFSSLVGANWHPVTMLSHMLDVQIFGLNPGWHHLTNLFFHLLNTLLLFGLLNRATGHGLPSVLVAALFALHPAHVESVAWVAERKDVLSTFFWLITMLLYARFVEKQNYLSYFLSLVFFTIGLMAKPMLVTLPFVLILFDFWPFMRMDFKSKSSLNLVLEKTPFFLIVVLFCIITFQVQKIEGAVAPVDLIPLESRIFNALVSYGLYLLKMIWPFDLAVFYPFPQVIPMWKPILAALAIVSTSVIGIIRHRLSPWLIVGWLWYLGTLIPVIGLVQIGAQSMADRYTYIPFIGLFISIIWEIDLRLKNCSVSRMVPAALGLVLFACLLPLTWVQIRHWRSSIDLYEHALRVDGNNGVIQNLIGLAKLDQNRTKEAIAHFSMAIYLKPDNGKPFNNLGIALFREGRLTSAAEAFRHAIQSMPNFIDAHINMGVVQSELGNFEIAMDYFRKALTINPFHAKAHFNTAMAYEKQHMSEKALYHYNQAIQYDPKTLVAVSRRIQQLKNKKMVE